MTPETFISLASGLAMVKAHTVMGAVRLAVHGKTFATVGWPEVGWAVIRLHPSDQAELLPLSQALAREPGRRAARKASRSSICCRSAKLSPTARSSPPGATPRARPSPWPRRADRPAP